MDSTLQAQIEAYQSRLHYLIRRGQDLRNVLASDPSDAFAVTTARVWQQDIGVTINELSGGSKAHWLARSFSQAFLIRSEAGQAIQEVGPDEIVNRLLAVLELATASLSQADATSLSQSSAEAPAPRRFDFVHNQELRPVLEESYNNSRQAFERGHHDEALRTSCGILEAIVTDALEHKGMNALVSSGAPPADLPEWSFETRLTVAERAGLIRAGWVRLPAIAFGYRSEAGDTSKGKASEQDARRVSQVLHVVMRDLDPGR